MTYVQDMLNRRIAPPMYQLREERMTMGERLSNPRITPLLWDRDYFVRAIPLPHHIGGASTLNPDGTFNIYVNQILSIEMQWEAFLHELLHCEAGHHDEWKYLPDEIKEYEADHLRPWVGGWDVG